MSGYDHKIILKRSIGRRNEDRLVREKINKHNRLFEVGQIITSVMNFDILFDVVMDQTNQIMETERSTVFLHDEKSNQLFSLAATGLEKNDIRITDDQGIAGWVFQNKSPLIINDVYNDKRFYQEVDKATGFTTKNIVCIPMINRKGKCVGVLQALNKRAGDFTEKDVELLTLVSPYVVVAQENSRLYEELQVLDKAKERVINHLAHELKTPLAIISTVFERFSKEGHGINPARMEKAISRGKRNVNRLLQLQVEIDDILNQKSVVDKKMIIKIIEDAASFVEEFIEEDHDLPNDFLKDVSERLESICSVGETHTETIRLSDFLHQLCKRATGSLGARNLEIIMDIEDAMVVDMDRTVLDKVCGGLLKNAIENTPDEGVIEIRAQSGNKEISIEFRDFGVGISAQNQELIFGGFFHTQDTHLYSSKKPYAFNAGGSGSDLLRTRVFSERFGFSVDFDSTRCSYLPTDRDMCAGRISVCPHIKDRSECIASGGSVFSIKFPLTQRSSGA
jgi:signal transduction histidine kinase